MLSLYLLCYAWIRYRQFSDNLVDAMFFHMEQLEDESRNMARKLLADVQEKHRRESVVCCHFTLMTVFLIPPPLVKFVSGPRKSCPEKH